MPESYRQRAEQDGAPRPGQTRIQASGQPLACPAPAPFGALLRRHRLAGGLTQAELAARARLSPREVRDLERGTTQPRVDTARTLALALALDGSAHAELLAAVRPVERGALRALATPDHRSSSGLPAALSRFIGRERQLEDVGRLLAEHRLVTLIGAGGVGKTRLALEVARLALGRSVDQVQFVALAPLADPALIESEVVHALGLSEGPGGPFLRTLEVALQDHDLLLILDNFEHLLDAAPMVASWLGTCPRLTVLVTSRSALGLPGEQQYQVPPLSLPALGARADAAEAVRLFVDRAWSVRPDFRLTETHVGAVVEICRRLDGLPLAIELAAARARSLTPTEIAARLDDRFRLLVSANPTAPPRQRTLQATIDWSHDLLSDEERILLRRLSVFVGGWTLEAAEAVCGGDDLPAVLDSLSQLIDKSLVMVDDTDGRMRYWLLEMIRQYSVARLADAGETASLRRRHATWVLALAEQASPEMWGPNQAAWLDRLEAEHENIRAALTWSEETGEAEHGLRFGWLVWRFWDQRGHYSEARGRLSRLLAIDATPSAVRASALDVAGMLAFFQQDLAAARPLLEEGLALGRALGDTPSTALALTFLGALFMSQGDLDQASARLAECEPLRSIIADELAEFVIDSIWRLFSGIIARLRGDERQAAELLGAGLARCRARGDLSFSCYFLVTLGSIAMGQGDYRQATALQQENLVLAQAVGNKMPIAMSFDELACIAAAERRGVRAARLFGAAEAIWESLAATLLPWFRADYEQGLAAARSQLDKAAFAAAWVEGREMPLPRALTYALEASAPPTPSDGAAEHCADDRKLGALTRREREILVMVGQGSTNRTIADDLVVSQRTVEWHVSRLLRRLDLQSRAQLAVWAREHGVVADR